MKRMSYFIITKICGNKKNIFTNIIRACSSTLSVLTYKRIIKEYHLKNKNNYMMRFLILMSTYNGEKFLTEQIDSILKQNDVDVFILIRDDGSQDNTIDILKCYKEKYPNLISLVLGENIGFSGSFHELTIIASKKYALQFDYFAFSDQDDVWLPNKLKIAGDYLKQNSLIENIPLLYCSNLNVVDEKLQKLRVMRNFESFDKATAFVQSVATGCSCVFNVTALNHFADTFNIKLYFHDYWMFLIALYGGKVIYDKNSYILYRQHGNNAIGRKDTSLLGRCKKSQL